MTVIFYIFIFGLIIGSFLNAVIYRLEAKKSVCRGRSFCPECKHILAWYDLIPLLSFIFLGGKCRYCHQEISIQYPLVELATGLLFVLIFPLVGGSRPMAGQFSIFNLSYGFYIISILIVIFVYDLKYYIIPDKIILPAIIVSSLWSLSAGNYLKIENWKLPAQGWSALGGEIIDVNSLLVAFGASAFFLSLIIISKGRWMGFGDVKLAFLMGLILSFPNILVALFTAFISGAIIGAGLILFKKKDLKSQIPFGPFLAGGTIFSLFFGEIIINWYLNILL